MFEGEDMIRDKDKIKEMLTRFFNKEKSLWGFGNNVLYKMCEEYPLHNNKEEIVGKVWLIGRSYAAAIERTKMGGTLETIMDNFLNKLQPRSNYLDEAIKNIKEISVDQVQNNLKTIFELHGNLTQIMFEATNLDKRSLASKYLHFHCPNAFFIYDSRARRAINALVKKQALKGYLGDDEYIEFCLRVLELQKFIKNETGKLFTPREIDNFLVFNN